jgi:hypothetical protein
MAMHVHIEDNGLSRLEVQGATNLGRDGNLVL